MLGPAKGPDARMNPDDIASVYVDVWKQKRSAWTQEIDLRTATETFWGIEIWKASYCFWRLEYWGFCCRIRRGKVLEFNHICVLSQAWFCRQWREVSSLVKREKVKSWLCDLSLRHFLFQRAIWALGQTPFRSKAGLANTATDLSLFRNWYSRWRKSSSKLKFG